MTAVEFLSKSGPYARQVCAGVLASEPLTGKNNSLGLRATCTIQLTAAKTVINTSAAATMRRVTGAARSARRARADKCHAAERRARRRPVRLFRLTARDVAIAIDYLLAP